MLLLLLLLLLVLLLVLVLVLVLLFLVYDMFLPSTCCMSCCRSLLLQEARPLFTAGGLGEKNTISFSSCSSFNS